MTATFVLVHGAWHGGWCWEPVAARLRAAGHEVHTPTLTGLGERAHLLRTDVDVDTHAHDIVATLEYRGLRDVLLVGHSYATLPATIAAVQAPDRVRELICLDGFVAEAGESAIELLPQHTADHYQSSSFEQDGVLVLPPRPLDRLGVTDHVASEWIEQRLVPHPLATYTTPVSAGASEVEVDATFLQCTGWASPFDHMRTRAVALGWRTDSVPGDHEVMVTDPELLVAHLLDLLARTATAATAGTSANDSSPGKGA